MAPARPLRSDPVVWSLRILQALVTVAVLGMTGDAAANWHSWHCSVPSRLGFNLAAVCWHTRLR